ncbi:MAG: cytochrome c [Halothiobacillaceae bacterium]
MAEHEVKVDPMAKVVTGVGALVLLVAVIYLIVAFVGTVNKNTTRGPVMAEPPVAAAPAAAPAAASAPAAAAPVAAGGAGDVAAGQALFATCAACHGAKGEGAGIFPKLAGLSADKAADLLKKYRAGETVGAQTAMMAPNAKALTDANITDLSAFIASLGGAAAVAAPAPAAAAAPAAAGKGDAALGKAAYATCAACHGANGEGAGIFPKLAGTPADKIADLLKKYRAGETVGANTAMMAPNAKALSDADIDNLAAYIGGMGGAAAPAAAAGATAPAAAPAAAPVDDAVLARGRAIYTTCALCHGVEDAHTSRLLNAPMMPGHPASAVTALMAIYKSGKSVGPNSSFMWPVAQNMTQDDIDAVAAYIGTLKPAGAH